jgi:hypothetical protein
MSYECSNDRRWQYFICFHSLNSTELGISEITHTHTHTHTVYTTLHPYIQYPSMSAVNPESLAIFYANHYPTKEMCRWLSDPSSTSTSYLKHREFSFTLPNDAYLRYHSYADAASLMADLVKKVPVKIDIVRFPRLTSDLGRSV